MVTTFANSLKPNKAVRALAVSPAGNLYVGGAFTTPRRYAAEVNASGALIPAFAPVISNVYGTSPEVRAIAVDPSGTRVILGGFFNRLNSGAPGDPDPTNLGIGAVDPTTGASLPWAWHTADLQTFRPFQLLAFAQDGSTLFGAASGNGGSGISWNMETGALNYIEGFNGNVVGVGVADGIFYMGGHFTGYCGAIPGNNFCTLTASRDKLAAVDEATGLTLSPWNPAVNTTLGIEAMGACVRTSLPRSPSAASSRRPAVWPSSTSPCSTSRPTRRRAPLAPPRTDPARNRCRRPNGPPTSACGYGPFPAGRPGTRS